MTSTREAYLLPSSRLFQYKSYQLYAIVISKYFRSFRMGYSHFEVCSAVMMLYRGSGMFFSNYWANLLRMDQVCMNRAISLPVCDWAQQILDKLNERTFLVEGDLARICEFENYMLECRRYQMQVWVCLLQWQGRKEKDWPYQ